jgi:hypothetical protein
VVKLSKQSDGDLAEVLSNANAALVALEPALKRYNRILSSDNYSVGAYLVSSKSCLQTLIHQARSAQLKAQLASRVQEPGQLDNAKPVVMVSEPASVAHPK